MTPTQAVQFASVDWLHHQHQIEYAWVGVSDPTAPVMVFLHEGLGSLALWKDFPHRLALAANCRGLIFSRWGYGQSSLRAPDQDWQPDFMHQQAKYFLPAFFRAVDLDPQVSPVWLYGHSDGSSIALLFAAAFPQHVAGMIITAPHIFVEDLTIRSIEKARQAYLVTDLSSKLARYHVNSDSAFWGWNRAWLSPDFRHWNITAEVSKITCPLMAIQGYDDEYGTMAQIDDIANLAPQTQRLKLTQCGHSPHRDQPEALIQAVTEFISATRQ